MKKDNITMSRKQLNRFDVLSKANDGFITVHEASEALGLSERQVKRLKKKVREGGADGVIHGNTGSPPSNRISEKARIEILQIRARPEYAKCNFAHFKEKLSEIHGIEISYGSLYRLMKSEGIKSPKTRRRKKPHRRRKRHPQAGLLLQIDASPFAWLGDRAMYSIQGAIDDATGQVTGLFMTKNECLHGYFELLRRTIGNYGIPVSIYADRHTIFQSHTAKKHELDPSVTIKDSQFARCLKELAVNLIPARSPQAKGRVERLWGTLQSRLPVEFAIHRISTIEAANAFLETYIYDFNVTFAVEPESVQNAFRKPCPDENIDHILCVKDKRTIDAGGVFSYEGRSFRIIEGSFFIPDKAKIDVLVGPHIGIKAAYQDHVMNVLPFVPPKRRKTITPKEQKPPDPHRMDAYKGGEILGLFADSKDRIYEREDEYFETIRLIEKVLLGKYR